MSRTQARLDADTPYQDGHIFVQILPNHFTTNAAAPAAATRPAAGRYGVSLATTAGAYVAMIPLSSLLFRYGVQDDAQEFFGSGQIGGGAQGLPIGSPQTLSTASSVAGAAINVAVVSSVGFSVGGWATVDTVASGLQEISQISAIPDGTHITFLSLKNAHTSPFPIAQNVFTTPYGVTGRPPFAGQSQLTPVTTARPKGILFKAMYPVYTISGAAASLNTIGLTQTVFSNVTAPVTSNIIAVAANGMNTATNAQPYLTPIPVPIAAQVFRNSRYAEYVVEWDVTNGGGGSAVLEGIYFDVTYNFN